MVGNSIKVGMQNSQRQNSVLLEMIIIILSGLKNGEISSFNLINP